MHPSTEPTSRAESKKAARNPLLGRGQRGPLRRLDPTRFLGQDVAERAHAQCEDAGVCFTCEF